MESINKNKLMQLFIQSIPYGLFQRTLQMLLAKLQSVIINMKII